MRAALDAPIPPHPFQQPGRLDRFGRQAGADPDGLDFRLAPCEFADAIHPPQLHRLRKPHLFRVPGLTAMPRHSTRP